ncbi:MAG: hypothetical protein KAG64_03555 [Bacteroidales bacterium]|nr:hypothetical protein [Bacteroidales bacterium]
MKIFTLIIFVYFSSLATLNAQFYETGQDPASIHWKQIKTEYFSLVYPDYAEKQAQHFANKLLWAAQQVPKGLNHQPKRIDIIMHMEASTSNAMVVWAPKRMEAYSTPPQSSYGEDWWEQIALHEFRHVVQVSKMRQGFTKVLSYVFGEAATGGVLGAYIPMWFLEGDAVATETALSETGRGRDPDFSMLLKAQILKYGKYSYDKAYNGSYKNYVPDHYVLGYHLTTIAQQKYGKDFWSKTLNYSARNPYMVVPFSHAIKKQSGLNKVHFYSDIMSDLDSVWTANQKELKLSNYDTLSFNNTHNFRNFLFPNKINNNTVICLLSGIDDISRIISININTGKIKILYTPGYGNIDNLSVADGLVVWNERTYNPRWQHRKFMVVKSYNLITKKVKQLSHKSQYFFPSIDKKGKYIVVGDTYAQNGYCLNIISAKDENFKSVIIPKYFCRQSRFSEDSKSIITIEIGPKGNSVLQYFLNDTNDYKVLLPPTFENISNPVLKGDTLLFVSSKSGISNIHALILSTNTEYQITSVPYGIGSFNITDDNKLIFNSYSSQGYHLAKQKIELNQLAKEHKKDDFYKSYLSSDKSNIQLYPPKDSIFAQTKYRKFPHLFNIHSWAPVGLNIDNIEANPGFTIASQNLLSSMVSTFGYEYRMNEQTSRYYANFSYKGWYPIIDFDVEYEDRAKNIKHPDGQKERFTYNSTNIGINIIQPLNFTRGKYSNYIQPSVGIYTQILGSNPSTPNYFPSGKAYHTSRYRLYMHHKLKKGIRDIETRWGQSIDINVRDTPFDQLQRSLLISAAARLYFPGFMKHHTTRLYLAAQIKDSYSFTFSDLILFPRGYSDIYSDEYFSFRFDYIFPIFYPDYSLGSLAYFKRLKGAFFFDYGIGSSSYNMHHQNIENKSFGIDLTTDLHFLRHMAPFEIGIRSAYLPMEADFYFQFLFSLGL